MSEVSITYCKPCGYLRRAEDAAAELQKQLGIAATLVPGKGGIFQVEVDGKVVARKRLWHFPDAKEIVAAVGDAVKTGA
jgi:selenoprotein W-related protein